MIESGVVRKTINNKAWVIVVKGEQCKGCNACKAFGEGSAEIIAKNDIDAKEGDRVEVEVEPRNVISHSIIVFIFPLIALIIGYFVGSHYFTEWGLTSETGGIIGSLSFIVISFIAIYLYDRFVLSPSDATANIIRNLTGDNEQK